MEKSSWVTGIALIVLVVAGILIWNIQQPAQNNQITQECSNQDSYCIYNNIPTYLKYASPNEEISRSFNADTQGVVEEYFKKGINFEEGFASDLYNDRHICLNGDKILIVDYFQSLAEEMEGMVGGGDHSRKAFVCKNIYFVEDFTSSEGPMLYGPFSIEN